MKIGRGKNISQRNKIIFYLFLPLVILKLFFTKAAKSPSQSLGASVGRKKQRKKNKEKNKKIRQTPNIG